MIIDKCRNFYLSIYILVTLKVITGDGSGAGNDFLILLILLVLDSVIAINFVCG